MAVAFTNVHDSIHQLRMIKILYARPAELFVLASSNDLQGISMLKVAKRLIKPAQSCQKLSAHHPHYFQIPIQLNFKNYPLTLLALPSQTKHPIPL